MGYSPWSRTESDTTEVPYISTYINHMLLKHNFLFIYLFIYLFIIYLFIFISWRLITLQYCSGFCHTLTRISHGYTCIKAVMLFKN